MKSSFIDQLEQEMWSVCITRKAPEDLETEYRWRSDEAVYLKEGFRVGRMPEYMRPILNKAIFQWKEISGSFLSVLSCTEDDFLQHFYSARSRYLSGDKEWEDFIFTSGMPVRGAVKNMDWVR